MWRLLYEAVQDDEPGTVYSFDDLSEIIGSDIRKNRAAVYRANKDLLKKRKVELLSVRGTGYRLSEGMSIAAQVETRHGRILTQAKWAQLESTNIDTSGMSLDQKNQIKWFIALNSDIYTAVTQKVENIGYKQYDALKEVAELRGELKEITDKMNQFERQID